MKIQFSKGPKNAKTQARVVAAFEEAVPVLRGSGFSPSEKRGILDELKRRAYKGAKAEDALVVRGGETILVLGLGKPAKATADTVRRAAARAVARAKSEKWNQIAVETDSFFIKGDDAYTVQALAEGFYLASYKFDLYKSEKKGKDAKTRLETVLFVSAGGAAFAKALEEARVIGESVAIARTLGNEPPNVLYPESYANRIKTIAREAGLKCTVFDDKKLALLKMGGILGVGQGSARKPRLVILEHRPQKSASKAARPVVLVGKGITFDTGGISLKPGKDMEQMKFDMCGSAAVVAALRVAAMLDLKVPVVGITPIAENMPGGGAQRPGDILTTYSGKTVDVLNTDAEGRLILADALAYAKNYAPRCIVDIATLTGLCSMFFGHVASGLMGNDEDVVKRLKAASDKTGERVWELPLWDEYEDMIKGLYGDIQNISNASAGTITAGMFLKHFGGHAPWAHLDVAGTAWSTTARGYNPPGATGVGVRLFVEFLKSYV